MTTRGAVARSTSSARAHRLLAHRVEVRRRLVEDQDRRVLEERAGDRHALALAARELRAALAHDRVEAVRQRRHELAERRALHGGVELVGASAPGRASRMFARSVSLNR